MKTVFSVHSRQSAPNARRGLTLLEMMVATTLLMVIVLGLTSMFIQTQKAFKGGLKQVDVMEGGRLALEMVARDFEQMSDSRLGTNAYNFYIESSAGHDFVQTEFGVPFRTNELQNIFSIGRIGTEWVGVGYAVSNCLPPPVPLRPVARIGTLYRFTRPSEPKVTNNIFCHEFTNSLNLNFRTDFSRVVDGVIHFKVRAFDQFGNEICDSFGLPYNYPLPVPDITNVLPHHLELELGIIEPAVFEQARSMGSYTAATNFLASRAGRVHIFRQQIPIRAASR